MKLIAIGDIHGKDIWKEIINKEQDADKIVFIGDYFDSYNKKDTGPNQLHNFLDILEFKKANLGKVEMLTGNHDFHYTRVCRYPYSGFQPVFKDMFRERIEKAIDDHYLTMVYAVNNFVFSHAGIGAIWCNDHGIKNNFSTIEQEVNDLFYYQPKEFEFTQGYTHSEYGDDVCQTPIWIRPASLYKICSTDYSQVVGHTSQDKINRKLLPSGFDGKENQLIFIDVLDKSNSYLKIDFDIRDYKDDPDIKYLTL